MRRVLVIGNAGSGKTTFAGALSEKTGIPVQHLDRLYWFGQWEHLHRDEFDQVLQTELEKERWIIDGNYDRTLPLRLSYCDTVFFFDLPTIACLWGATKRVLCSYGKSREDMGGNCPERFDRRQWELYRHIWTFNRKNRKHYYALLKDRKDVVVFKSRRAARKYIREAVR